MPREGEARTSGLLKTPMPHGTVPSLPVLRGGGHDHPEWRRYVEWVYGEPVPAGSELDLNAFSWFYWNAPLAAVLHPRRRTGLDFAERVARNTAWTCFFPFLPQCKFSPYGFFVARRPPEPTVEAWTRAGRLEVARVRFHESGAAWFYHAVGSGVFLNLDALPVAGRPVVHVGPLPALGAWDNEVAAYMAALDCNLLVVQDRYQDGKVEIVVRAAAAAAPLDAACPFADAVFSTGLAARRPCSCSDGAALLNCRGAVAAFLEAQPSRLWRAFLLEALFYLWAATAAVALLALALRRPRLSWG